MPLAKQKQKELIDVSLASALVVFVAFLLCVFAFFHTGTADRLIMGFLMTVFPLSAVLLVIYITKGRKEIGTVWSFLGFMLMFLAMKFLTSPYTTYLWFSPDFLPVNLLYTLIGTVLLIVATLFFGKGELGNR